MAAFQLALRLGRGGGAACRGIEKPGSVHIFRHTVATLMHDAGADIRDLQENLGHAQLSTTEICTRVSIERLKAIRARIANREIQLFNPEIADRESLASTVDEWAQLLLLERRSPQRLVPRASVASEERVAPGG